MPRIGIRTFFGICLGASLALQVAEPLHAQPLLQNEKFPLNVPAASTGEEAAAQPRFWAMEVSMKPMRFIDVAIKDPVTGKTTTKSVWYLVYKAVNRPLPAIEDTTDRVPVNDDDREPAVPLFVPRFELHTDDFTNGVQVREVYPDVIIPEAEAIVARRERRRFKNTVDVIQPVPAVVAKGDETEDNTIYGVAMWTDMPPETDYFSVYLSGFSNGYRYVKGPVDFADLQALQQSKGLKPTDSVWIGAEKLKSVSEVCDWKAPAKDIFIRPDNWLIAGGVAGLYDTLLPVPDEYTQLKWMYTITPDRIDPNNRPNVWRKVIRQHFTRYGDEIKEREDEFRPCGDPMWLYQPEAKTAKPAATDPAPPAG